jgi:hypothetical protein
MLLLPKVIVLTVFCAALAIGCRGQAGVEPAPAHSDVASSPGRPSRSLPEPLASVLSEIKAKSRVPVLLPSKFSDPIRGAKYAVVESASDNEYSIILYYELGIGDAGFAAFFEANAHPNYGPKDIGNVREVKLSRSLVGYFRPVSCGGSCAPANIWWKENQVLYQIQLKLSPDLREDDQQKVITAVANSAILAGPR